MAFTPGESVVQYFIADGSWVPAIVEATDLGSPEIVSLFVLATTGYFHVDLVSYDATGTAGHYAYDVATDITGDLTISGNFAAVDGAFSGTITGDVTGDLTGNVTGNVTGDVTGDLTGNVTGDVAGAAALSALSFSGSSTTSTTPYTLGAAEYTLYVDATAGNKVVNLPAASATTGREYFVEKIDASANTVTITRAGADTIEGATTLVLSTRYERAVLQSDGTATWYALSRAADATHPGEMTTGTQTINGIKTLGTGTYTVMAGDLYAQGQIICTGLVSLGTTGTTCATSNRNTSSVADGAAAVSTVVDCTNTFSTAGAKLLSVRNNTVEKTFVDKDGNVELTTVGASFILKSPDGTRWKLAVADTTGALTAVLA